jgi:hypothetical protein
MGKIEEGSRKRAKRVQIENIILGSLTVAGGLSMALFAPNILRLLKHADPEWLLKRDPQRRIRESVSRLKRKGLVEFRIEHGKKRLRLTKKGQRKVDSIWSDSFTLTKPKRWDGKWRLVIFDIPERKRVTRNKIRALVSRLGFLRLQDSVWVYPYDCEELVTLLKADLKIGLAVLYIIADAIEFDTPIRRHFGLPLE